MNYQQFIDEVERRVKEKLEGNKAVSVYVHTTVKNNGKERRGLTVSRKEFTFHRQSTWRNIFSNFRKGKPSRILRRRF